MTSEAARQTCSARDIPILHVARRGDHHSVHDLHVDAELELVPTPAPALDSATLIRAIQALSADHAAGEPEGYALAVVRYCMQRIDGIAAASADVRLRGWDRLGVGGRPRPRDMVRPSAEIRIARAELSEGRERIAAGLRGLLLMTPGGAEGVVVLRLDAVWTYGWPDVPFGTQWQQVRRVLTEAYAERETAPYGVLVQELGRAVLDQAPPVSEIEVTLDVGIRPPVDMNAVGLENTGAVFGGAAAARTVHGARLKRTVIL